MRNEKKIFPGHKPRCSRVPRGNRRGRKLDAGAAKAQPADPKRQSGGEKRQPGGEKRQPGRRKRIKSFSLDDPKIQDNSMQPEVQLNRLVIMS